MSHHLHKLLVGMTQETQGEDHVFDGTLWAIPPGRDHTAAVPLAEGIALEADARRLALAWNCHGELLEWVEILADILRGHITPVSGDLKAVEKLIAKAKGT